MILSCTLVWTRKTHFAKSGVTVSKCNETSDSTYSRTVELNEEAPLRNIALREMISEFSGNHLFKIKWFRQGRDACAWLEENALVNYLGFSSPVKKTFKIFAMDIADYWDAFPLQSSQDRRSEIVRWLMSRVIKLECVTKEGTTLRLASGRNL